jgi:hypothetical protein
MVPFLLLIIENFTPVDFKWIHSSDAFIFFSISLYLLSYAIFYLANKLKLKKGLKIGAIENILGITFSAFTGFIIVLFVLIIIFMILEYSERHFVGFG